MHEVVMQADRHNSFVGRSPARGHRILALLPLLFCCLACDDSEPFVLVPPPIDSPEKLILTLVRAYDDGDPTLFASLLANDPGNQAEYVFLLAEPTSENETQWGYDEEARLHRRMFDPAHPDPGDAPVPSDLWLHGLTITLTPISGFTERADLYTDAGGTLDRDKWRASSARYTTYLLFELAGEIDYRVEGESVFVVIEDLEREAGAEGKFFVLIWEDLGSPGVLATGSSSTWSSIKDLYR